MMWASPIADNAMLCNGNQLVAFNCRGIERELSLRVEKRSRIEHC